MVPQWVGLCVYFWYPELKACLQTLWDFRQLLQILIYNHMSKMLEQNPPTNWNKVMLNRKRHKNVVSCCSSGESCSSGVWAALNTENTECAFSFLKNSKQHWLPPCWPWLVQPCLPRHSQVFEYVFICVLFSSVFQPFLKWICFLELRASDGGV